VAVKAQTGASGRGEAHPQGGPKAEPERSERLARSPVGADTAAGSHPDRLKEVEGGHNADTVGRHQDSEPVPDTGTAVRCCELAHNWLARGSSGECFDAVASIRLYR
jgi:hypothetical protein